MSPTPEPPRVEFVNVVDWELIDGVRALAEKVHAHAQGLENALVELDALLGEYGARADTNINDTTQRTGRLPSATELRRLLPP